MVVSQEWERKEKYVLVRVVLEGTEKMLNLMRVLVQITKKMEWNMAHTASDAPTITNVYVATVDGRSLLKNRSCVRTEWCTPLTLKYVVRTEW